MTESSIHEHIDRKGDTIAVSENPADPDELILTMISPASDTTTTVLADPRQAAALGQVLTDWAAGRDPVQKDEAAHRGPGDRIVVEVIDHGVDQPCHKMQGLRINGARALIAAEGKNCIEASANGPVVVTLALLPDELHFIKEARP